MDTPPKLGPEVGVLRIGEIVAWIRSRFREPPEHLPSTNPDNEAAKSDAVRYQAFISELAERDITDPRVQDWIDEYRRTFGVSIETDKPAPPVTSGKDAEAIDESHAVENFEESGSFMRSVAMGFRTKLRQAPPRRKQLCVLLIVAAWVSFQFLIAYGSYGSYPSWSMDRPSVSSVMAEAFVYSLPAVLFGGVLFWWFGKQGGKNAQQE